MLVTSPTTVLDASSSLMSNMESRVSSSVKPEPSDASRLSDIPSPSTSQDSVEEPGNGEPDKTETSHLERLCTKNVTLDALETGVTVATDLLDRLLDALRSDENENVDSWIKSTIDLQKRTAPARTVVGVVGNTGAGKSSVINALLDEERFVYFLFFLLVVGPPYIS